MIETALLNFLNTIGNINFLTVGLIVGAIFVIFWLVVLDWVWLDSGERTTSRAARICYLLLVLILNILGWIIYLIIRPSQTIEQIYWSDLERRYLKFETLELGDCPKCGTQLYLGYVYCPKCGIELKIKCGQCGTYIEKNSAYCPFCGNDLGDAKSSKEVFPTKEVMEQQIEATRQEAVEAVDTSQVKYSVKKKGVTVKLGEAIIGGYRLLFNSLKKPLKRKTSKEKKD
jgi:uncharacterized Zn finger protein (UPF0148 family)